MLPEVGVGVIYFHERNTGGTERTGSISGLNTAGTTGIINSSNRADAASPGSISAF